MKEASYRNTGESRPASLRSGLALAGTIILLASQSVTAQSGSTAVVQPTVPAVVPQTLSTSGPANAAANGPVSDSTNAPASDSKNSSASGPVDAKSAADANEPPVKKILLQPGKSLSINMETEDIVCTNDVDLARRQRDKYPDSPEASFICAVAMSRTSHVEDALKEVRRARRLAEKQGGPSYFDKMIDTYEKMLTYYPDDNQVRYHLAWAYYMKAYVLAKYSKLANTPQAKYKEWVAQAANPVKDDQAKSETTSESETVTKSATAVPETSGDVLKNIQKASSTISSAAPQAIPQVQKYYALAQNKLDDILARDPSDVWARVYHAFLRAEASGDLVTAMAEWQKVIDQDPTNPAAYFFLGQGYLKQGNLKECLSNVSKAVALRAVGN